jgi:hypothetical protein
MSKGLTLLKSTAFAIGFAGAAYAQPPLEVYETKSGAAIGRLEQANFMARDYGHNAEPISMWLSLGGLSVNAEFLFTTPNCTGKAYTAFWWDSIYEPHTAEFDGTDLWQSDGKPLVINAQSYSWFWDGQNANVKFQCIPFPYQTVAALPVRLETVPQWAPACNISRLALPAYGNDYNVDVTMCKSVLVVK